jgi:hypothetical protein
VAIEKIYNIDDYVRKLEILEEVSKNLQLDGKGILKWTTRFDGELYTLTIYHVNEL